MALYRRAENWAAMDAGVSTVTGPDLVDFIQLSAFDILLFTMSLVTVMLSNSRGQKRISVARFAWATLCCNVLVVLWGAYVRATGSGAGCGNKWPVCNGDIVGASAKAQTIIEFTHRATSGIALLMVACLVFWCWQVTSKRDWARYSAIVAAALLTNEALLGGALVLFGHVAQDQSAGRMVFLCLHFGNTLLLLATLSLTAAWLQTGSGSFILRRRLKQVSAVAVGLLATMSIGITGALAALGDTLFPASSLRSSLRQDFSSGASSFVHFRIFHPVTAIIAASYVIWVTFKITPRRSRLSQAARVLMVLFLAQGAIGVINVVLLAPVWLQILHLFVADMLWISLVLVSADLVLEPAPACQAFTMAT
jgi:heme a synthase